MMSGFSVALVSSMFGAERDRRICTVGGSPAEEYALDAVGVL
jgi:hypothetical protein